MKQPFPFSAIVGQSEMKRAMILTAIDPKLGGVLVFGDRGTGKSTAVRALAALLPEISAIKGCPINSETAKEVPDWAELKTRTPVTRPTPVVDLSIRHPARFVLVGSGNPEEGELRPQLLDRFGLSVEVRSPTDIDERIEVIKRRDAFESNPKNFLRRFRPKDAEIRDRILTAREKLPGIETKRPVLKDCAQLCVTLGADGLRGELTLLRAGRALAAFEGDDALHRDHLRTVAPLALSHRLRRDPLDEAGSAARVARTVKDVLG